MVKSKGTSGQSGATASSNGWAKSHGDKLGAVQRGDRDRHWFWLA